MTRLVLGNPPPPVLNKNLEGWITEATPICGEFAYALHMHVTSLHPVTELIPLERMDYRSHPHLW